MEQNKAIEILVQVALLAQSKGLLSLEDAVVVKNAIEAFKPVEEVELPKESKKDK